jgi:hypothetical protein
LIYSNALGCYFWADDFLPLSYLYAAAHGHPEILLHKLVSPWQEANVQLFYRPLSELTMALDYALWGANALGYHLTNLLLNIGSTLLLLAFAHHIFKRSYRPAWLPSFAAAALFAASPLHMETVVWMIGRVDSVCMFFYLLCCCLFAFGKSRPTIRRLSLGAYICALLCKETAITLPALLALYVYFFENIPSGGTPGPVMAQARIKNAVMATLPFWLTLIPYFAWRYAVLGTFLGGYIGSIGQTFSERWFDRFTLSSLFKIVYPYSDAYFDHTSLPVHWLHELYLAAAIFLFVRARICPWGRENLKVLGFSLLWLAICVLPTLPAFYLNSALTGGRFLYAATAPISMIALLVLAPDNQALAVIKRSTALILFCVGYIIPLGFAASMAFISYEDNKTLVAESTQVRQLKKEVERVCYTLPDRFQLAILNTPKREDGEHLLYTAAMLEAFLKPPVMPGDLSAKFSALSPNFYLVEDLANASLIRRLIAERRFRFVTWDRTGGRLLPVDLARGGTGNDPSSETSAAKIRRTVHQIVCNHEIQTYDVEFPNGIPLQTDAIEVQVERDPKVKVPSVSSDRQWCRLSWHTGETFLDEKTSSEQLVPSSGSGVCRYLVSCHQSWWICQPVHSLSIKIEGEVCRSSVVSVRAVSGKRIIPMLEPDSMLWRRFDTSYSAGGGKVRLWYDASCLPGARAAILEISGPNAYFEHYSRSLRDTRLCAHDERRIVCPGLKGNIDFSVEGKSIRQVRLAALDADGKVTGSVSDPVTISTGK